MCNPSEQQKADQVNRLNQVSFDFPISNLAGDAGSQAWHARKCTCDHRKQVVRNDVREMEPANLSALKTASLGRLNGVENCIPEKDLSHDG